MPDEPRVQELLDELLDRQATPEEVCGACPELLPVVRDRWRQICRARAELDALLPPGAGPGSSLPAPPNEPPLPEVPGYAVEAVLGQGGMGVVFRARHLRLNRVVALKMLLAGAYAGPHERERFQREAEVVARLRHANIVHVYDVGDLDGRPYFTMEYVEGCSLAQKLAGTPQPAAEAAALVVTLAEAIQVAHQSGIVHRDLKPGNILLTADATPKVADFGLARRLEGGGGLTLTGVAVGTPSYMAPEQGRGNGDAIGPATDVYALGAILYELLTGRPPFRAETAAATLQQVLTEDPVPPSRLNPRVPRDLETICLKCLHKEPPRRYASARELADDLGRFLGGKPIRARPVSVAERAVKWARRRPATALLVAALPVLFAAAVGAGFWLRQQEGDRQAAKAQRQGQAREAIETALGRVNDLRRAEKWPEAQEVLAEASTRLAEADSPPLEKRLKQAELDCRIAADLQRVRESSPFRPTGEIDYRQRATEFQEAFERAGLRIGKDAEPVVDYIRPSAIRDQLVAALEDRAIVVLLLREKQLAERLLEIARLADPEPRWCDRFRQLSAWENLDKLRQLAAEASNLSPPPPAHELALLGCLLRRTGTSNQGIEMLREACRRQPGDFWLNSEMGDSLCLANRTAESAAYYRAALALRPNNVGVHQELGKVLFAVGQIDDAVAEYRRAVQLSPDLSPDSRSTRQRLVSGLGLAGRWVEATDECHKALDVDPTGYRPPYVLGMALYENQRDEDAIVMLRKAVEADPEAADPYYFLGLCLIRTGRHDQAVTRFRRLVELTPQNSNARDLLAKELAAVGRPKEAITELQTGIALVPSDVSLLTNLGGMLRSQGQPEEAASAFRKAASLLPISTAAWNGLAAALLDADRFADARAATERLLNLPATDATRRAQRRQLDLCDALLSVEADLPAILAGNKRPAKASTQLAVAEWCLTHRRLTATAASLYAAAITAEPAAADDLEAGHRFRAARAAAQAGCGTGEDAATLDDTRRGKLRRLALDWLMSEFKVRANRHRLGKPGDRTAAAAAVRAWQHDEDLAGVRDEPALARLPLDERRAWQALWADVAALAARDPVALFGQARAHIGRREWSKAAACYAEGFELEPTDDGELWFEYAATQLLAQDRPGYRRTCAHMLARCQATPQMRPYLVARACTLAPDAVDDWELPRRLSEDELTRSAAQPWSLTEQAALKHRAGDYHHLELLERSLAADGRPGNTVLNWLWLTFAYQQMGRTEEARRWLDKAVGWMDQQDGRMPLETTAMGLNRHNWLEAHVLRREAEEAVLR